MVNNYFLFEESLSLVKQNKIEEALNTLDKLIEDEPNNNAAWYLKEKIYEDLNKFDEKTEAREKAEDLTHLKKKADCIETLGLLDDLNGLFPYDIDVLNLRGYVIGLLRRYKGFLGFFQDHLKILEKAVEYHENIMNYKLGFRLIWEKMSPFLDSLKMQNEKMVISTKTSYEGKKESILLHVGSSLFQFSLFNQIIQWFEFLIEEFGIKSACIFNNFGVSMAKRLDAPNAISYFQKALAIEEDYSFSLNNIGVCEGSVSYFDDILKVDDMNTNAYFNKAFSSDNLEENLKYCKIIIEKTPEDAECWHLQGLIQEKLGDQDHALESYRTSLEINPKDENVLSIQGELLIKMGKYGEAIKIFNTAIKLDSGKYLWDYIIEAYRKLNDKDGELNCYERMLEKNPGDTSALYGKGTILIERGNYDEAVKLLDRVKSSEMWDDFWFDAIFQKARIAALRDNKNETFKLISEAIRAGAATGGYREDLHLKKRVKKTLEFEKYEHMEEFKSILNHDFNTKEEKDKFWDKYIG